MRTLQFSTDDTSTYPAAVFATVRQTQARGDIAAAPPADRHREGAEPLVDVTEAHALRALHANGFGAAAITRTARFASLAAARQHAEARAARARGLGDALAWLARGTAGLLQRAVADWRRQAHVRATYRALRELDDRTLRDLGMHRSEILSVAVEFAGQAEPTRARVQRHTEQTV